MVKNQEAKSNHGDDSMQRNVLTTESTLRPKYIAVNFLNGKCVMTKYLAALVPRATSYGINV